MTARGLIIAAPHSGAGKTTVTLAILAALHAARRRRARGQGRTRLYRSGIPCRSDPLAERQSRFLGDAATAARRHGRAGRDRRGYFCDRRRDGAVRRHRRRRRATRRDRRSRRAFRLAGRAGARCVAASAIGGGLGAGFCRPRSGRAHRRRHPEPRRQRTPSRARRRRHRGARHCRSSAPCRARRRWHCPSAISASSRPANIPISTSLIERLAAIAERHLDLDAIMASAAPLTIACGDLRTAPPCRRPASASRWRTIKRSASSIRICSPHGAAPAPKFCRSRRSPTSRRRTSADCCWLPGGYPELHAERSPRRGASPRGCGASPQTRPVHGECGGYMVLGESLEDAAGQRARHDRAARPRDELRQTQAASRLPHRAAIVRHRAGTPRRDRARPRIPLRVADSAGDDELFAELADGEGRDTRQCGRPARPCHRHILSRHCDDDAA